MCELAGERLPGDNPPTPGPAHFVGLLAPGRPALIVKFPAVRCELRKPQELLRLVAQDPEEPHDRAIQVIDGLHERGFLGEEDTTPAEEWLYVLSVGGQQGQYLRPHVAFAAEPAQG